MFPIERTVKPDRTRSPSKRESQLWEQFSTQNPGLFKENRVEYIHAGREFVGKKLREEFGDSIIPYLKEKGYR